MTYGTQPTIALFEDIVTDSCVIDTSVQIDIDAKGELTEEYLAEVRRILDDSTCLCTDPEQFILSTPYFYYLKNVRTAFEGARCVPKTNLFFHPDSYPVFSEHFFLKTKLAAALGKPDMITAHYLIWDAWPDLLDSYNEAGFCTGIYGHTLAKLDDYPVTGDHVFDTNIQFVDLITYDKVKAESYANLFILLFLFSIAGVVGEVLYFTVFAVTLTKVSSECSEKEQILDKVVVVKDKKKKKKMLMHQMGNQMV